MPSFPPSAQNVPVVETARLRLRAHQIAEFADCAAMWADPVVTRYIGGRPFSEEEVWARVLRYVGHWLWLGFGYWAVEEKATGNYIGEVGFADFKRDIQPSIHGLPELGWVLTSGAHGKGYATEAVQAAIAWGQSHFGSGQTVCLIHPENVASLRVAEKCGFRESLRSTYKGQPAILFARLF
jgi:RimJ/RimL family protein N-acetyltransferase